MAGHSEAIAALDALKKLIQGTESGTINTTRWVGLSGWGGGRSRGVRPGGCVCVGVGVGM